MEVASNAGLTHFVHSVCSDAAIQHSPRRIAVDNNDPDIVRTCGTTFAAVPPPDWHAMKLSSAEQPPAV